MPSAYTLHISLTLNEKKQLDDLCRWRGEKKSRVVACSIDHLWERELSRHEVKSSNSANLTYTTIEKKENKS